MERAGNPTPNVLLMLSMALGAWGLVYVAAASVWSWRTDRSEIVTEGKHHQQVAAAGDAALEDASVASCRPSGSGLFSSAGYCLERTSFHAEQRSELIH